MSEITLQKRSIPDRLRHFAQLLEEHPDDFFYLISVRTQLDIIQQELTEEMNLLPPEARRAMLDAAVAELQAKEKS